MTVPASTAPQVPPQQDPPQLAPQPSSHQPAPSPPPSAPHPAPPTAGHPPSPESQVPPQQEPARETQGAPQEQTAATAPPVPPRPPSRGADTRALTQVLFGQLKDLEPGSREHTRVRAALIEANLPLVRYAAARFRSRNEPMEDVVQVGTIGLINAIDRFDPERGVQFPTFAMPTVVGEIKRYFRDNVRTVHVPRRLHELWVQVNAATEDLTTLHGRTPTTHEIAERLRITEDEVLSCIEAGRSYHATSLEAAQEGDGMPGLLDRLGYEDPELAGVEHRDLVRHLLVQLPEREQRILLLRYYNNLTQSQISVELGVSQMHVSRLLARSFARLRSANRIEA
ncbi:RNA polymerase sigma factor SigF [Streptomyces subrutilus]|uniref:RNA polymerase sigma factor SigF n=1 Tax=Streptomyces subrutilus TaxID=36818 RepID=A0A5P2ULB9_9ACTN|nr:RNA polymerase sigma factor SigF [Streptomyces subrutilus]